METIIGRKADRGELEKIKNSRRPEFVAIYRRRRIGKTYLIREAFDNKFDFYLTVSMDDLFVSA